jgi:hypothetical protein
VACVPAALRRPSGPPPTSPSPRSPPGFLALVPAKPFPPPQGSDTIPIVCSPAVQFNPFHPASLNRLSLASPAQGPPDNSLFFRRRSGRTPYGKRRI